MKKLFILGSLMLTLTTFGATRVLAFDYYHDDKHWYDAHNKPHTFVVHNHHHGYWDHKDGAKVFINID